MRLSLTLGGLLLALIIAISIFGERATFSDDTDGSPSLVEEFMCALSGGCYSVEAKAVSPYYAQQANLRPGDLGFLVQHWAEPDPDPHRQERVRNLLNCTQEARYEAGNYDWPTQESLYWQEGSPPPPTMIERAERGDADTMFDLGFGYLSGHSHLQGLAQEEAGLEWLHRAADEGHMIANTELGATYMYGYFGQHVDYAVARRFLSEAVQSGDPMAMLSLALLPPEPGEQLHEYAERRLELELRSAELCYDQAIAHIVTRLEAGRGLEPDPKLARVITYHIAGIEVVGAP